MIKLILRPTLIMVGLQALALAFYGLLHAVLGGSEPLRVLYALLAVAALIVGSVFAGTYLFETALPEYQADQLHRQRERERLAAQIDAEIGIPRVAHK